MPLVLIVVTTVLAHAAFNGSRVTILPLAFGGVGAALGLAPVFWSMAACLGAGGWIAARHRAVG